MKLTEQERFWSKADRSAGVDGCWNWVASKDRLGYGKINIRHKTLRAHRYAYEITVAPIPTNLEIDHICRNRACVNPLHMRVCTHSENMKNRSMSKANTSGFKGVSFWADRKKWAAQICANGINYKLGLFATAEEAYEAYKLASAKHGEFAHLP